MLVNISLTLFTLPAVGAEGVLDGVVSIAFCMEPFGGDIC